MKSKQLLCFLLIFTLVLAFSSCKKESGKSENENVPSSNSGNTETAPETPAEKPGSEKTKEPLPVTEEKISSKTVTRKSSPDEPETMTSSKIPEITEKTVFESTTEKTEKKETFFTWITGNQDGPIELEEIPD